MKITKISWANYRRLPDGEITVRDHLVLVGPNDTGKSSIVRAANLCIGMAHGLVANSVSARDFSDPTKLLQLSVTLGDLDDDDRAAFPDEITTGPPELLVVAVEASQDPSDPDRVDVRRFFPDAGHAKAPTREQMKAFGFRFVPAVRSLLRELGGASGGAVRSLLSDLDLTADAATLEAAAEAYKNALDGSTVLEGFRTDVAAALTNALPTAVDASDVRVVSESELLDDPISGVTVTLKDGGHDVSLAEQSDGIRAIAVLTLLGMNHASAQIVAVDEPETHLYPSAQRAMARSLVKGAGQRILVTHAPAVVSQIDPLDIVALRADRQVRQLPDGASVAGYESLVKWWSHRFIEPLTARSIAAVEGPSDRIVVDRVAELLAVDLDQLGIALFDLGGADNFPFAYQLFGPAGFDLRITGLVDEDRRERWAKSVGVAPADLETAGFVVCNPDLEGVYIDTLGVDEVVRMLLASPLFSERRILGFCKIATLGDLTRDLLWGFCTSSKVDCALAVAAELTVAQAKLLTPLVTLLNNAS
jgi:putative ATP-dependent endonuclease of OLD family